MKLLVTQKRKWRNALKITLSGIIIALLYPVFNDGFKDVVPFINALIVGLVGGLTISFLELEVFHPLKHKSTFIKALLLKSFIYFILFALLIPLSVLVNESIYYQQGLIEYFNSNQFQSFLFKEDFGFILFYVFIFIGAIIFIRQINRKLGQGILTSYISGRFHQPQEVERIFMHIDLRSSMAIAEKLGELKYHNFLHDFFLDITDCILSTKGNIYTYVADQVIVTWDMKSGLEHANCIKLYFCTTNRMKRLREKYLNKYGLVPRFSTSLHCGKVIIGELGDVKSQIVYQGEVLYQTSAIERKFSEMELEEQILISESLIQQITLPSLYKPHKVAEVKGLENTTLAVFTLKDSMKEIA